ncbi:GNAT family N-acetyltransferase [Deinococcus sonorensis]|uniref:GNAT family N-acetyltransferase n=2 Tax=Deinococcus sonorensis TaxID=309891 RepID=A0AAU7U5P1_9DEIO
MTRPAAMTIRELRGLSELQLTPPLARAIWGDDDHPEDPALLQVVQRIGGLVAGAVDDAGQLWAYLVALPTREGSVQHSHRLGVHPTCRGAHLGERLKRFQRDWALQRGIQQVRWTFDPLLLINAHLNIHRLGAVVRTFLPDYYGQMSGINAGAPSDRFEAEWALRSARAEARLAGHAQEPWPEQALHPLDGDLPGALPDRLAVCVPADFSRMLREDRDGALAWRRATGPLFTRLFAGGHTLTDVHLARAQYLFTRTGSAC